MCIHLNVINQPVSSLLLNTCGNLCKSLNVKNSPIKAYFREMYELLVDFTGKLLYVTFLFSLSNVRISSEVDVLAEWQFDRPDRNSIGRMPYSLLKASPSPPPLNPNSKPVRSREVVFINPLQS